jgi:hypothetical protein
LLVEGAGLVARCDAVGIQYHCGAMAAASVGRSEGCCVSRACLLACLF